jgi:hypothetical protein
MATTALVTTWECPNCPFLWQFSEEALGSSPYDLSPAQLLEQFPEYPRLQAGKCPNCHRQGVDSPLGLCIDEGRMTRVRVSDDSDLESVTKEETDQDGNPVLEQVGERETLGIVDGKPAVVTEPIYEPKQRELTTKELKDLKAQRNQSLDQLETLAVKEVSDSLPDR